MQTETTTRGKWLRPPRPAGYHITARFSVGGDGGWDHLTIDTARSRVFVARSDRVMVVDEAAGKMLAEIPGSSRGHGVALDYSSNHGFAP